MSVYTRTPHKKWMDWVKGNQVGTTVMTDRLNLDDEDPTKIG